MEGENRYLQTIDTLMDLENIELLSLMGLGLMNRKTMNTLDEQEIASIDEALGEIVCLTLAHHNMGDSEPSDEEAESIINEAQELMAEGSPADIIGAIFGVQDPAPHMVQPNHDVHTAYV